MKYRKKPVVIEAEQFKPENMPYPIGVYKTKPTIQELEALLNSEVKVESDPDGSIYRIDTLEGPHIVHPGDWIITGIKGERYACKPDIFEATYEKAE